jgi:hypothetical protein
MCGPRSATATYLKQFSIRESLVAMLLALALTRSICPELLRNQFQVDGHPVPRVADGLRHTSILKPSQYSAKGPRIHLKRSGQVDGGRAVLCRTERSQYAPRSLSQTPPAQHIGTEIRGHIRNIHLHTPPR